MLRRTHPWTHALRLLVACIVWVLFPGPPSVARAETDPIVLVADAPVRDGRPTPAAPAPQKARARRLGWSSFRRARKTPQRGAAADAAPLRDLYLLNCAFLC